MAQRVKRLPAVWETGVRSLGREDPLEKEMTAHSSIPAWRVPWTEQPVDYSSWGHKESDTTEQLHFHFHKFKKKNSKWIRNGNIRPETVKVLEDMGST